MFLSRARPQRCRRSMIGATYATSHVAACPCGRTPLTARSFRHNLKFSETGPSGMIGCCLRVSPKLGGVDTALFSCGNGDKDNAVCFREGEIFDGRQPLPNWPEPAILPTLPCGSDERAASLAETTKGQRRHCGTALSLSLSCCGRGPLAHTRAKGPILGVRVPTFFRGTSLRRALALAVSP